MAKPMSPINLLDHPICFNQPIRLIETSAWIEHVPFGMFIIDLLRPEILVELGTQMGVSYSAFCQAVKQLGLSTRCYAIDTWEGDSQAGYYDGSEVLANLKLHHDPLYGEFSRLVQSTFDEAADHFQPGSIDLLHIDGLHTYEAVKHDFENWLPKMSNRGIVLFHDINVRERDFGVWKFWIEVENKYSNFVFTHGHGLGVLYVGKNNFNPIKSLTSMPLEQAKRFREIFFVLGSRLSYKADKENLLKSLTFQVSDNIKTIQLISTDIAKKKEQIDLIEQTVAERDERIMALDQAVSDRDRHLIEIRRDLGDRDEKIAALTRTIEERDVSVAEQNGQITALTRTIEERDVSVAEQNGQITALNGSIADLDQQIKGIFQSVSWRVTGPLRRFRKIKETIAWVVLNVVNDLVRKPSLYPLRQFRAFLLIRNHPLFDRDFYLNRYQDVRRYGLDPVWHYIRYGAAEGRNPGPDFNTLFYMTTYPDVQASGINPLFHFIKYGSHEGRLAVPPPLPDHPVETVSWRTEALLTDLPRQYQTDYVQSISRQTYREQPPGCRPGAFPPAGLRPSLSKPTPLAEWGELKKVIICATHVLPCPPRAGNEYRIYRLLKWLVQKGYLVIPVVSPLNDSELSENHRVSIQETFPNSIICHRTGSADWGLRSEEEIARLETVYHTIDVSDMDHSVGSSPDRDKYLVRMEKTFCPDSLVRLLRTVESFIPRPIYLAEYVFNTRCFINAHRPALKLIDTIDVFSFKNQKVVHFGVPDILHLFPEEETRLLNRGDVIIGIQLEETVELKKLAPEKEVITVGVDFDFPAYRAVEILNQPPETAIIYIGSANAMNIHGITSFISYAWPLIIRYLPQAKLHIVGNVCQHVAVDDDRIRLLGPVENLGELYLASRVVINPAVAGTGLKIKTVEALSYGRRVVAFPAGIEGLPAEVKGLCRCAADWYEFYQLTLSLLISENPLLSEADFELVKSTFHAESVYGNLERVLDSFHNPSLKDTEQPGK
jgi:hypothetical protein